MPSSRRPDRGVVALRAATASDAVRLTEIAHAAYSVYLARMGVVPPPMTADFGALVDSTTVAEHYGTVIGYVVVRREDDHVLVENLAVAPDSQGAGVGRLLIEHAEQEARGVGVVRLYTNETMTENQRLYERLGYRETGRGGEYPYRRVFYEKAVS